MASLNLSEFITIDAISFGVFESFLEASEAAGKLLVSSGAVTLDYVSEILEIINNNDPYMVIAPGIAIVHGRPAKSVLETGASIVISKLGVTSGNKKNDPVRVILAISAMNDFEHLQMLSTIAEIFSQSGIVEKLVNCSSTSDVLDLVSINLP